MKVICFHNPGEINGYLSNWYLSPFTTGGTRFSSLEQYMMYEKAVTFGDMNTAERILATDDVAEAKRLGRGVMDYNDSLWNGIRQIVVYEGLIAKFSQNADIRRELLATGSSLLAECAVKDTIWGIGLSMTDSDRLNPWKWKGQNLLGYALMKTREKLSSL